MKKQLIAHIAKQLHSYGYSVYISKSGEYGFYTDGVRCVCFGGTWKFSIDFSGNYRPVKPSDGRQVGTGWQIAKEQTSICEYDAEKFIKANAPYWATGDCAVKYTTPEQHLKMHGNPSGYILYTPV